MSIPDTPIKRSFRITRSPLIWLGLFGAVFIVWSWVDSMHQMSEIGRLVIITEVHPSGPWGEAAYTESYGQSGGCLRASMVIRNSADLRIEALHHKIGKTSYVAPDARWFPMPSVKRDEPWSFASGLSYTGTTFLLPHWILLVAYLTIWTAAIAWRRSRMRRATLLSR